MPPTRADLEAFADHCREQFAGPEEPSVRAVQLRIVEPLIERLGWDLRGGDVEPDVTLGGWDLDYLLHVDGVPAVAVAAVDPGSGLDPAAGGVDGPLADASDALERTGVDWALVTDGREFLFLTVAGGDRQAGIAALSDLPDARASLARYSRSAATERLDDPESNPDAAARQLAANREDAIDAVTGAVVDVAGEGLADLAHTAAAQFVDQLADLAAAEADGVASSGTESAPTASADAASDSTDQDDQEVATRAPTAGGSSQRGTLTRGASSADTGTSGPDSREPSVGQSTPDPGSTADGDPGSAADRSSSPASEPGATPDSPPEPEGDGEFVVRFFEGNSSIGAVGTEHPGRTLAGAVGYLAENHGLAESITLPWSVEEGRSIVAATPEHPGGDPMEHYRREVGGVYVWTGVDAGIAREAIDDLAGAAGLRAMFQGEW